MVKSSLQQHPKVFVQRRTLHFSRLVSTVFISTAAEIHVNLDAKERAIIGIRVSRRSMEALLALAVRDTQGILEM
jgi:hypothetical protein